MLNCFDDLDNMLSSVHLFSCPARRPGFSFNLERAGEMAFGDHAIDDLALSVHGEVDAFDMVEMLVARLTLAGEVERLVEEFLLPPS